MPSFFPTVVNWASELTEDIEYGTQVFRSADRREVRESTRLRPLWEIQQTVLLTRDTYRALVRRYVGQKREHLFTPVHTVYCRTSEAVEEGTSFYPIPAAQQPDWLVLDSYVSIGGYLYIVTLVTTDGISVAPRVGNAIGVDLPVEELLTHLDEPILDDSGDPILIYLGDGETGDIFRTGGPAGMKITMVARAYLASTARFQMVTSEVGQCEMSLRIIDDDPRVLVGADWPVLDTREVLSARVQWGAGVSVDLDQNREVFEAPKGNYAFYWPTDFSARSWQVRHIGRSNSEAGSLIGFFNGNRGRRGSFYFPDPTRTFQLAEPIGSADTTIGVEGVDHTIADEIDFQDQYVVLRTNQGDFYREVQQVNENVVTTDLVLDTSLGVDLSVAEVYSVSSVHLSRFATDTLSIAWLTSEKAEITMSIRTMQNQEVP